tara:strand:+ start:5673 stop:6806 length:1134 start_codon:yes stop_codon:yes gene_type:complete
MNPSMPIQRNVHIRHVVRQYHPAVGGLEESVAMLARSLNERSGITSSVVTLDRLFGDHDTLLAPVDEQEGVQIVRIPFRGSTRYPLAPRVLRTLAGADIIHVHGIDFFFDFLAATKPMHRRTLVASTHGGFFHTKFAGSAKKIWFNTITRGSSYAYHRIFGSSLQDAETFARIAPARTVAIENGVNVEKWRNAASQVAEPVLLFIGRFSVNKDLPALIKLIATLGPPWQLIIAGQDSDLTARDLMAIVAQHNAAGLVTIVRAPDNTSLRELIGRASFIVSASRYEGFGLSAVEGMSAGLTPILSAIAPFERLVRQSGRGRTVDFNNFLLTADVVRTELIKLKEDTAGNRARNISASDAYGWPKVTDSFISHYRSILG